MSSPASPAAEPFRFPSLVEDRASLHAIEKSLLGHFILLAQPKVIIETGVYRAVTTRFLIEFLELNNMPARVVSFDLPEVVEQLRREQPDIRRWEAEGRLELVGGELPLALRDWLAKARPEVGVALIDARHIFASVLWELRLVWPWLARDGYIVGHDYCADFDGVRYAFDHFARKNGAMLLPLAATGSTSEMSSVLVAMRRRSYEQRFADWLHYRWEGLKTDLVLGRVTGPVWRAVRPLLRGSR
jgi:hypothetical protein